MATYEITVRLEGTATITVEADTEAEAWDEATARAWVYGEDGHTLTAEVDHVDRIDD